MNDTQPGFARGFGLLFAGGLAFVPVGVLVAIVIFGISEGFFAGVFGVLIFAFMFSPVLLLHLVLCAVLARFWCPESRKDIFVGGGCCLILSILAALQFDLILPIH